MVGDGNQGAENRAGNLLDRYLANRNDRTSQAYAADVEEFARFVDRPPDAALAHLLAAGPAAAHRIALEYIVDLRRRGRAQATIDRRTSTLRALVRTAHEMSLVDWQLELPSEQQVEDAMEKWPTTDSEHYLFPRHPGEVDRLDIQHYALRETLGTNHLTPLDGPRRILDVGCGTGQWGFEMARDFPTATVVGLDLVSGKRDHPARYHYVRGNVLHGLPFADGQFDYVHQRFLVSGVPLTAWPDLVDELARVTRPGGWIELIEFPWKIERAGPAAQRVVDLTQELTTSLGLDTQGEIYRTLDERLQAAGLVDARRHEVAVPVGRWGGQVGSLMVTDFRAGATRVCEHLQSRGRLTAEEVRTLIQEAQEEWEHGEMAYPFAIAFAQKPA